MKIISNEVNVVLVFVFGKRSQKQDHFMIALCETVHIYALEEVSNQRHYLFSVLSVQETVVSEEIMHNLDTCEVTVVGDELDGEHESLEVDRSQLQQRALEMSSSNLGLVITGTPTALLSIYYQENTTDRREDFHIKLSKTHL